MGGIRPVYPTLVQGNPSVPTVKVVFMRTPGNKVTSPPAAEAKGEPEASSPGTRSKGPIRPRDPSGTTGRLEQSHPRLKCYEHNLGWPPYRSIKVQPLIEKFETGVIPLGRQPLRP